MFLTFLYSRDFYFTGARESPNVDLLVQRKVTKEKTPSLRNFLPYQAKTVLSAPRRYRSCPSELPASILNRGSFRFVYPFGYEYLRLMTKGCHAVPISIGIVSASHHKDPKKE